MAEFDRALCQCRLVVVWSLTCSVIGQCCPTWEGMGLNKNISYPRGLGYFPGTGIFCSGFPSPSIVFSSLENSTPEVFQLTFHHNPYASAESFRFTKSLFCFPARNHFIRNPLTSSSWDCSALRSGAHRELNKSALRCPELQPWASFLRAAAGCCGPCGILWTSVRKHCHVTLRGVWGEPSEMVEGELMAVCAPVPLHASSAFCYLTVPSEQSACGEIGFLLLCSSAIGTGDQTALLQQVVLSLSLLSVFPDSKITFK